MSEPTKTRLKAWFISCLNRATQDGDWTNYDPDCEKSIRALIESSDKGPEVDEGFVEWARDALNPYPGYSNLNAPSREGIRSVLHKAGVRVKEET